jgi:myo-inositol-1(or 4)-monophosphatase
VPSLDVLLPELRDLAVRLAKEAGAFLRSGLDQPRERIDTKSTGTDMVSEMDRGAERLIVEGIRARRPNDGLLGEEGTSSEGTTGFRWVIDPLDGTTNYLYGHPLWCVSIGIEFNGRPVVGVVDAPMLGETFVGADGLGASVNERSLSVSTCDDLGFALIGTGFGYAPERRAEQGVVVARFVPLVRDLRRGGSAALDLCYVAAGRLDGYYERGLNPWDACAGSVIVREAGGVATGLNTVEPNVEMTIAGNAFVHGALRDLLVSPGF